jgi:ferric enterobactin receptor
MKIYLFTILFIAISLFAKSQTIDIFGSISDSTTILSFGNIIVKNKADSVIRGVLTNEAGEFKIKNFSYKKGMYILVTYMGYVDKKVEINYTNSSKINLGKIVLSPDVNQIKEVSVVGKAKYMEQQFDRKVFNINAAKTTSAKNIFDLLRTLPGVTVEQNDNVKYKGAPATIYVDDQPAEFVYPKTEMIPVANVLKIELIDASLRSGAGKGGIINIKMRNMTTDGLSGVAQFDNNTVEFKDLNNSEDYLNVNYKIKKVLFFYNVNYNHMYSYSNNKTDGSLNFNTSDYIVNSEESDKNMMDAVWNYGGFRFSPNSRTRFRLTGGYYKNIGKYPTNSYSQQIDNNSQILYDKYDVISDCDYNNLSKWINASFYHSFDSTGKELSVYVGLQNQGSDNITINTYNYQYIMSTPIDSTDKYSTKWEWGQLGMYGGIFHNHPINAKTRWNFGYNGWFQLKGNTDNTYSQNGVVYLPKSTYTKGTTQSQSASWRIGTTLNKWKLDAGIEAEYDKNAVEFTRYKINLEDTLLMVNKDYFHLLPSTTIVFSPDSVEEIKLTYSRSVQSVWYSQLCDFMDKDSPRNWSTGNSKLQPTSYNNLYLGYAYNKPTWNINADIFYSVTNNDISYLTIPYNDVISINMPANISHNRSIGIELASWVSIKEKCDLNISSSVNNTNIETSTLNDNGLKKKDFGFNVKFNSDVFFSKTTTGTFYINYFSREITFEGYKFDYINSSVSLTHKFFDNKLMLTLGVNNLFDNLVKHGKYYNYSGIVQKTTETSSTYRPTYFITLQYKFRQGDRGTKDSGNMRK